MPRSHAGTLVTALTVVSILCASLGATQQVRSRDRSARADPALKPPPPPPPFKDGAPTSPPPPPPPAPPSSSQTGIKPPFGCNYGALPGMWMSDARLPAGYRWQTIVPGCELEAKLHTHVVQDCIPPATPRGYILVIGDSVDAQFMVHWASHVKVNVNNIYGDGNNPQEEYNWRHLRVSGVSCGGVAVASTFIPGVSTTGPYNVGVTENYQQMLLSAWKHWHYTLKLPAPKMVFINCNMWDVARVHLMTLFNMSTPTYTTEGAELPRPFILDWLRNGSVLVDEVRRLFPGAAVGWHTVAVGLHNARGVMQQGVLGKRAFVTQLNAAGRVLAAQKGLLLVDTEIMTQAFHNFTYLEDWHHPTKEVQLEIANIYLNLLDQLPLNPAQNPHGSCTAGGGAAAGAGLMGIAGVGATTAAAGQGNTPPPPPPNFG